MIKITHKISLLISLLLVVSCLKDKTPRQNHVIHLKWNKSYTEDSFENALIGLSWAFSHVGAINTNQLFNMTTTGNVIAVNVRQLGFSATAEVNLEKLNSTLINSEEFANNSAIDMGRYVALLIGASEHYYTLTEMPLNFSELLSGYELLPVLGLVDNSAISVKHRIIKLSDQTGLKQLFITEETDPETGELLELETVDLMANGQPRFGIFDVEGNRVNAASALNSEAGKPGKCIWCHESGIQPLFFPQSTQDGYLTYLQLQDTLIRFRNLLQSKQQQITTGVDYTQVTEHIQMELLYISFMEPSIERLSKEWDLSSSQVETLLEGLPTHENEEFPFLGTLYDRNMVEEFSPYNALSVSSKVREKSEVEVNHMLP